MTIIRIGLDTSKHVFQLHGVDETEQAVLQRQLRRSEVAKVFAKLAPTRIGLEAGGASHHRARVLRDLGHEVMLLPPQRDPRPCRRVRRHGGQRAKQITELLQHLASDEGVPALAREMVGATAVIRAAKPGRTSPWLLALLARKSKKLAAVALANKMARIVWAIMVSGETYRQPAQA
jgi:transposase